MEDILNLMTWNCKGVMSALPYLSSCIKKFSTHICALSEHWLRTCNIHFLEHTNPNYITYSKSVDESLPSTYKWTNYRKGVALLMHRSFDQFIVNEISIDSDRIIGVEACLPSSERIFIFSIYMPAASLPIQQFKEHVDSLHEPYSVYSEVGKVVLMGDFNAKIEGSRYQFKPDDRSIYLQTMLNELNVFSVNSDKMCVGLLYTFQGYENGPVSMIDHIVISKELTLNVRNALVLTEGSMNVSDHYPVLCKLSLNTVMSRTVIYS
jgi:exonuclease III